MMNPIKATGENLIIRREPDDEKIGAVHVPIQHQREHFKMCGRVVSAGPDSGYEEGQVVWFVRAGAEFDHPSMGTICVVRAEDVFGVDE